MEAGAVPPEVAVLGATEAGAMNGRLAAGPPRSLDPGSAAPA